MNPITHKTFKFEFYIISLILFPVFLFAGCENSTTHIEKVKQETIFVRDAWSINVSYEISKYDFGLGSISFVLKQDTFKYFSFNFYEKEDSTKLYNIRSKEVDINSNPPLFYDKYTEKYCILLASGRNTCAICVHNKYKNICSHLNTIFDDIIIENDSLDMNEIAKKISESRWEWETKGDCNN